MNQTTSQYKREATRTILLPVKKHIAKAILFDRSNILKVLTEQEKENLKNLKSEFNISLVPKIFFRIDSWKARYSNNLKSFLELIVKEPFYKNFNPEISYYRNRRNLPGYLESYIKKGFSILKITTEVKKKQPHSIKNSFFCPTIQDKIDLINSVLEMVFIEFLSGEIEMRRNDKTISEVVNYYYRIFNFQDTDLKKATLIKQHYRYLETNSNLSFNAFFEDEIHNKISNYDLKRTFTEHLSGKKNISEISKELNYSKSAVSKLFNSPELEELLFK